MKYFTTTDIGRVRKNNEDSYFNFSNDSFNLFIVCDGMGGHNAGEVASKMATEIVSNEIIKSFNPNEIFDTIANSIKVAHIKILEKSQNDLNCRGMGTTLILALIYNDTLYYANVGDSRIYLYH
ncbi:MAG: protein phosphatase 2C domain-containing protein, partial [Helcococcus sp.]|nr:protein phosphatase 2C domain-containing protein [Helcococcus sp.]